MGHKEAKLNKSEQQEERRIKKNEKSIISLWNNFKRSNILIIGVPEREEKEQEIGNLFEKIMKENFLNFMKEIDMQAQEAQRVPIMMDAKRLTPRHIIINMSMIRYKGKNLKSSKRKAVNYLQGSSHKTVS